MFPASGEPRTELLSPSGYDEECDDAGEKKRHETQAVVQAAEGDALVVVLDAEAVDLHGQLRVQLLHRHFPPGLPIAFGVSRDDVLEVPNALRVVRSIFRPRAEARPEVARTQRVHGL